MNRLILKYGYRLTAVILLVFAWVIYRRLAGGVDAIIPLAVAAIVVWVLGSLAFIYYWPRITVGGFKRAILRRGFGGGPIPVNTLYAVLDRSSESATSSLMGTGTDDVLYIGGWLDVSSAPRVLHVPEMDGRYSACSSQIRPAAPISLMSANGPPGPAPAISSSAKLAGRAICQLG